MAIYNYSDLLTDTQDGSGDQILTIPEEFGLKADADVLLLSHHGSLVIAPLPNLRDFVPFDNWIPQEEMVTDAWYFCRGRNFTVAQWTGTEFRGERTKFRKVFWATEKHWDDGVPWGTVKPLVRLI